MDLEREGRDNMSRALKGLAVGLPLSLILWAGILAVVSWVWSLL